MPRWLAERAAFALCARDFAQQLRTLARPLLQALRSLFTRIDVAQRQRVAAFATSVHHTEGP
ncbi:hypothetical protein [Xanthomonas vesicatoria]|uniref:hypothetical protein n=1 Tax=Xanthomonas vesicatoria TaxID=56460 RepID=UPI001E3028D8|nr:hypothetical protein [Xanthomonas vesicatoria]MCC8618666.1 hypothetical protein [Xanthomonas vesicatoria]